MTHKTNAVRLLDQLGIRYELREYEVDLDDLAAETVAAKIGLPSEQVFKTLVARGDRNGICLVVIPGNSELDLKALAVASGNRKIQLVPVKECRFCLLPQITSRRLTEPSRLWQSRNSVLPGRT